MGIVHTKLRNRLNEQRAHKTASLANHLRRERPPSIRRKRKFGMGEPQTEPEASPPAVAQPLFPNHDVNDVSSDEGDAEALVRALCDIVDEADATPRAEAEASTRHVTLHFNREEKIPLCDVFDFTVAKVSPWGGQMKMFAEFAEKNLEEEMTRCELDFVEELDIMEID